MKRKAFCTGILLLVLTLLGPFSVHAQSSNPQQTLNQYVADLQKNPNDYALREKIIKHVHTMRQAPAIPEKAREHYVMAATFAEKAKDNSGYERAIEQYRAALLAAPWWADAYKRLALTQKAAARYDDAITNLNLYVLTKPPDAREAQDEIYKLKALKQTAADAAKDKELAAKKAADDKRAQQEAAARKQEEFLNKINGARYAHYFWANRSDTGARTEYVITLDVRGDTMTQGQGLANGRDWSLDPSMVFKIDGRTLRCFIKGRALPENDGVISDDGSTITVGRGAVFKRVR